MPADAVFNNLIYPGHRCSDGCNRFHEQHPSSPAWPIKANKVRGGQFWAPISPRTWSEALHVLGSGGVGGFVGAAIQDANEKAAHQNISVFAFDKVLIDSNPEVDRHAGENQVGCDNRHEGEYYPSEISGGHDVVVTWLKFTVDNQPYHFRIHYQFQPENKDQIAAGIQDALQMSIQGIAPRIQL